jgi:hypothetical protein
MIKLFGDGLDALVAINLLLKSGSQVTHYSQSDKFGGHFRGIDTCGGKFDFGLMLLEPDFVPGVSKEFEKYEGEFGRNSRAYLGQVFGWLENQLGNLINHEVFTLLPSNEMVNDYFIGDSLDFLNTLNLRQRNELEERLISLLENSHDQRNLHPAYKLTSEIASKTPLSALLAKVYGSEIYEIYFAGFFEKVTGDGLTFVSARDHRKVWMPNFYPESILFALNQDPENIDYELKQLRFLRPEQGEVADFVQNLQLENEKHINYRRVKIKFEEFKFDFSASDSVYFIQLNDLAKNNWFESQYNALFVKNKVISSNFQSIHITHFCLTECKSRTVFVADKCSQVIRYSYYSHPKGGAISVESIAGDLDPKILALQLLAADNLRATCNGHSQTVSVKISETNFTMEDWLNFSNTFKSKHPKLNQSIFLIHPDANNFNDNLLRGLVAFRMRETSEC